MRKLMAEQNSWDVVIVGGGPAGLSAALTLGRCCRKVLVCDFGPPRNWAAVKMHGYLGRDYISPQDFITICHNELSRYPNVSFLRERIIDAKKVDLHFELSSGNGKPLVCRKLLLATGLHDELPKIKGMKELFGKSVFQCPYCDGWEVRNKAVAAFGEGNRGLEMARALMPWTCDLILFTDGNLSASQMRALKRNNIKVRLGKIAYLDRQEEKLKAVVLENGEVVPRDYLFFDSSCFEQSPLARLLGCAFNKRGGIKSGRLCSTSVPGVFVAGNVIKDVHLAIVAAAEGAKAAMGINKSLTSEDFTRRKTGQILQIHPDLSGDLQVCA